MKDWNEYTEEIFDKYEKFNSISITIKGYTEFRKIPDLIYFSSELISNNHKNLLMLFPEVEFSLFVLAIFHSIFRFNTHKLKSDYKPDKFRKGDRLKCGKAVVRFDRIENNGKEMLIYIEDAELIYGVPMSTAPIFQHTNTKKKLSKHSVVQRELKIQNKESGSNLILDRVKNFRTHINETLCLVTVQSECIDMFQKTTINEKPLLDLMYVARLNRNGEIRNVSSGKLEGHPGILVASDLYAVLEAIESGIEIKRILLPIKSVNVFENDLDALDDLIDYGAEVVCVSELTNDPYLKFMNERNFETWKWSKELVKTILPVNRSNTDLINRSMWNYVNHKIHYKNCDNEYIDEVFERLFLLKRDCDDFTGRIPEVFNNLYRLSIRYIRTLCPITDVEKEYVLELIEEANTVLETQKKLVSLDQYELFCDIVNGLKHLYIQYPQVSKINQLNRILLERIRRKILILIKDSNSKEQIRTFWKKNIRNNSRSDIEVLTIKEFMSLSEKKHDLVVVTGWFDEKKMRRILFNYCVDQMVILLYGIENQWRLSHQKKWRDNSIDENNKNLLTDVKIESKPEAGTVEVGGENCIEEIEAYLESVKFNKYQPLDDEEKSIIVEALPIEFHGGTFCFFGETHKVIVITEMIKNLKKNIVIKESKQLSIGDIIVVRESSKDIVRDLADNILKNSGYEDTRDLAGKWHGILNEEMRKHGFAYTFSCLNKNGCKVSEMAVKNWVNNTEMITPQEINDIEAILSLSDKNDNSLSAQDIYDAGKIVKRAHIKAGRVLSQALKERLRDILEDYGADFDLFDSTGETYIEGIGNIRILKVESISEVHSINKAYLNKLINEWG